MSKKAKRLVNRIIECDETALELWDSRPSRRSSKIEIKLLNRIHKIHELEEALFYQLWDELTDEDLDSEFELVEKWKNHKGFTRFTYCNGVLHLETDKKKRFRFGTLCTC